MPFKAAEIVSSLLKKGFVEVKCKHHRRFFHCVNGVETGVKTRISHSEPEYGDSLLGEMKKQLKLSSKAELLNLINCPMTAEEYNRRLKSKGIF